MIMENIELTRLPNLRRTTGDLLTTRLPAVAHGCNVKGLMGKGLAKTIRKTFPNVYPPYAAACANGTFTVGSMLPIETSPGHWVFNLASQDLPGKHARLDWLSDSLDATIDFCRTEGIRGFALPRIGAGIGGLEWDDVHKIIWTAARDNPDILIEVWTL